MIGSDTPIDALGHSDPRIRHLDAAAPVARAVQILVSEPSRFAPKGSA
jgi:hypothetical protein